MNRHRKWSPVSVIAPVGGKTFVPRLEIILSDSFVSVVSSMSEAPSSDAGAGAPKTKAGEVVSTLKLEPRAGEQTLSTEVGTTPIGLDARLTGSDSNAADDVAPLLPAGTYTVAGDLAGFQTFSRPHVVVNVGSDVTVNLAMRPGLQETITVSAEAPVVEKKVVEFRPFVIVHEGQHYLVRKGADGNYIILGYAKPKKHHYHDYGYGGGYGYGYEWWRNGRLTAEDIRLKP